VNPLSPSVLVAVAAGGAAGSVARWLVGVAAARFLGTGFPWGTLAVNVVGGFAIGVLAEVLSRGAPPILRPLLITGFLGGFTTFSAFALEAVSLARPLALLYVAASVALTLGACALGIWMARAMEVGA
jgi:CrcB protein